MEKEYKIGEVFETKDGEKFEVVESQSFSCFGCAFIVDVKCIGSKCGTNNRSDKTNVIFKKVSE